MSQIKYGWREGHFQRQNKISTQSPELKKSHGNIVTKMVYYFTSSTVSPAAFIYVGKDKVESKRYRFLLLKLAN